MRLHSLERGYIGCEAVDRLLASSAFVSWGDCRVDNYPDMAKLALLGY